MQQVGHMSQAVTQVEDYRLARGRRPKSAVTRYVESLPELERREIFGLVASTITHALVLLILSILWMKADQEPTIEVVATIDTTLPEAAVAMEPEILELEPDPIDVEPMQSLADIDELEVEDISVSLPEPAVGEVMPATPEPAPSVPKGIAADVARIQKRVAEEGGKTGEVQFSLSWQDLNDADLHVIVPEGRRIFWGAKAGSQGRLDVDMNVKPESKAPVENVRWLRRAPAGRYTVVVHWFKPHVYARGIPFQLMAKVGEDTKLHKDTLPYPGAIKVFRFRYIPPSIKGERRKEMDLRLRKLQEDEERKASRLLKEATAGGQRNLATLSRIIVRYPHTDAALEAMNLVGGAVTK